MNFKHFNLRESRSNVFKLPEKKIRTLDRRKFLKNIGLSALAINPLVKSVDKIVGEPFHILNSGDSFIVKRNARICWQFPVSQFSRSAKVSVRKIKDVFLVNMRNVTFNGSPLSFDFSAKIYESIFGWRMKVEIPQFGVDTQVDFLDWLDKQQLIEQRINANLKLGSAETQSNIQIEGDVNFMMDTRWNMFFEGTDAVTLNYAGNTYSTSSIVLSGRGTQFKSIITVPTASLYVKLPTFSAWSRFVSEMHFSGDYSMRSSGANPDLNFLMWKNKQGIHHQSLWVSQTGENLSFAHRYQKNHDFGFSKFFLFSEIYANQRPEVYLAAISTPNQWISNKLGSFQVGAGNDLPDFEAFGYASDIRSYRYAPQLTAFKPVIPNALTLPAKLDKPVNIVLARYEDENLKLPDEFYSYTENAQDTASLRVNMLKLKKTIGNTSVQSQSERSTQVQPEQQKTTTIKRESGILKVTPKVERNKESTGQQDVQKTERNKTVITEKPQIVIPDKRKTDKAKLPEISTEGKDIITLQPNELKFRVLRPEDLLLLEFEFRNFILTTEGGENVLSLQKKGSKGLVIVRIQTQHTLEEAFFEANKIPDPDKRTQDSVTLPARHLRAYRSRLVFEYPAGGNSFPLNLNELLDWSKFELRVDPRAWVNVPNKLDRESILRNPKFSKVSVIEKNKTVSLVKKQDISYGLKLNQANVMHADRLKQYDSETVNTVFSGDVSGSLLSTKAQQAMSAMLRPGPVPEDSTCIEAPALMYISPNQTGGFEHRIVLQNFSQPDSAEIYEMWHTKLGVRLKDGKVTEAMPYLRSIRALWAFDAKQRYEDVPNVNYPMPFRASLDANNRHILVHTTSNYSIDKYKPAAVPVKKLMLTPLGAYLDWHVFFDVPTPADNYLNIIEWEHFATLGRDHYVKIVKEGYLFPFGHRAALVTITERKFMKENRSAVNRQHMYIVVLQKEVIYGRTIPQGDFLKFPFQAVEIVNSNTPDIDDPLNSTIDKNISGYNFYIHSSGKPFDFDLIFTDKEGAAHKKKIPLIFTENIVARTESSIKKVVTNYTGKDVYNNLIFDGENISYAESLIEGDTLYETREIKFGAVSFPSPGDGEICFRPVIQHALIKLEAVNQLTGNNDSAKITLVDDSNKGHVFAAVENAALNFSGAADKAGGFLTPNMSITGLSRLHGTVGGAIDDAMKMAFDAAKVFETMENILSAKIFGVIDIFSLFDFGISDFSGSMDSFIKQVKAIQEKIEQFRNALKLAEANALELEKAVMNNIKYAQSQIQNEISKIRQDLDNEIGKIKNDITAEVAKLRDLLNSSVPRIPNLKTYLTDDAFHVQYKWQPDLGNGNKEIYPQLLTVNIKEPKKALQIDTHFEKPFAAGAVPILTSLARFENFSIEVADCIAVNFKSLKFETDTSGNSGVKVQMGDLPMQFTGALSFINSLNDLIPSTGFSDDGNGPYLELTASGIKAGYTLALPNFEMGICMITNVSLGAYINLPFTGDPLTIGFFFCTRENPFMLTISCFGGGGFVKLVTRLDGLESIEADFEFGAAISLNVGVASGSVSVMGGIYYKSTNVQKTLPDNRVVTYNQADLTAYLRINGKLSILGLIHVSLEFYLELHAVIADGRVQKLEGSATLKVKVSVLFFSKTVSVTVRRTLAGSGGDPNFAEMISPDEWEQYCLAFGS